MMKVSALQKTGVLLPTDKGRSDGRLVFFIFVCFVSGLMCGTFAGIAKETGTHLSAYTPDSGAVELLVRSAFLFALLYIFSTSYFGMVFVPALIFARGYIFSCALSVLYIAGGREGMLLALKSAVIPMAIVLPALFTASSYCIKNSCCLFRLRFSAARTGEFPRGALNLPAVFFSILFSFLYYTYILPRIV